MSNIFQKNWRWFVTTILAILAVVVPVYLFYLSDEDKLLSYEVLSISPLFSQTDLPLQILIDGENIEHPYFSVVRIVNAGDTPISRNEFDSPISIELGGSSVYVSVKLSNVVPKNLSVIYDVNDSDISVAPMLLNPGDEFTFEVLTDGEKPDFEVLARLFAQKNLHELEPKEDELDVSLVIMLVVIAILASVATGIALNVDKGLILRPFAATYLQMTVSSVVITPVLVVLEILGISTDSWWPGFIVLISIALLLTFIGSIVARKICYK